MESNSVNKSIGIYVMELTLWKRMTFLSTVEGAAFTLYQPKMHICVMSSHKPICVYMGVLILGVNTLYRLFCFFKLFLMVGKGLILCAVSCSMT